MKEIAVTNFYSWSIFSQERQIDFNGHLWVRDEGNVLIDPVPMTAADLEQFDQLGGAAWIVLTNCDHEREAAFSKTALALVSPPIAPTPTCLTSHRTACWTMARRSSLSSKWCIWHTARVQGKSPCTGRVLS